MRDNDDYIIVEWDKETLLLCNKYPHVIFYAILSSWREVARFISYRDKNRGLSIIYIKPPIDKFFNNRVERLGIKCSQAA